MLRKNQGAIYLFIVRRKEHTIPPGDGSKPTSFLFNSGKLKAHISHKDFFYMNSKNQKSLLLSSAQVNMNK